MLDAISGDSLIAVTVGELFAIAGAGASLVSAVVGVYLAGLRRDERAAARLDDLERWKTEEWAGGDRRKGGYQQIVDSLRYDQIHGRGEAKERRERASTGEHARTREHTDSRHRTMGPGHDTRT